jgi:hypothetical protein
MILNKHKNIILISIEDKYTYRKHQKTKVTALLNSFLIS